MADEADKPQMVAHLKILSMGSGGVGKSCLIKRYCEGGFSSTYNATIGVDYGVKTVDIDGTDVRINFWDLAGHPEFRDVRVEFYGETEGVRYSGFAACMFGVGCARRMCLGCFRGVCRML